MSIPPKVSHLINYEMDDAGVIRILDGLRRERAKLLDAADDNAMKATHINEIIALDKAIDAVMKR